MAAIQLNYYYYICIFVRVQLCMYLCMYIIVSVILIYIAHKSSGETNLYANLNDNKLIKSRLFICRQTVLRNIELEKSSCYFVIIYMFVWSKALCFYQMPELQSVILVIG